MDEASKQKLQAVIYGYRALAKLYLSLHTIALENGRLSPRDIAPTIAALNQQQIHIDQAKTDWWMFYSHVKNGQRICGLPWEMVTISFNRNHDLIGTLENLLLEQVDQPLDAMLIADFRLRGHTFLNLADNTLAVDLITEGLLT